MTPESFCEEIQQILGKTLFSVVLYSSTASGEPNEKYSDYNLMVVFRKLVLEELDGFIPLTERWA